MQIAISGISSPNIFLLKRIRVLNVFDMNHVYEALHGNHGRSTLILCIKKKLMDSVHLQTDVAFHVLEELKYWLALTSISSEVQGQPIVLSSL